MSSYARAKWIVETNAKGQSKSDAEDLTIAKVMEYVNDPRVLIDAREMLTLWSMGNTTDVVFTQLDKQDYENLSDQEHRELIAYWCNFYLDQIMINLKKRLEV